MVKCVFSSYRVPRKKEAEPAAAEERTTSHAFFAAETTRNLHVTTATGERMLHVAEIIPAHSTALLEGGGHVLSDVITIHSGLNGVRH